MGKIGWVVGLDRVRGTRGDDDASLVKRALWRTLVAQWNEELDDKATAKAAIDWLDDVITLTVDTGTAPAFTVWFDLSVEWPSERGDHWLRAGLVLGRHALDDALAAAGFRLRQRGEAAPFPSMRSEFYDPPSTRAHCDCPLCKNALSNWALHPIEGYAGHAGEALDRRATMSTWKYVPSLVDPGNALWICAVDTRIYATWDAGARYERVDLPAFGEVVATCDASGRGRFLVAGRQGWFRSDDGGAHWQAIASPGGECVALVVDPDDPKTLLAIMRVAAGSTLERSGDGGVTWELLATKEERLGHVVFGHGVIHAIVGEREAGHVASTSDCGGTWVRAAELPFSPEQILVGRTAGTFVVFGTVYDPATREPQGARHARTTDGGRTFTFGPETKTHKHQAALAHPSGRWFHVPASAEFLQFSDDEGASWAAASDQQPQTLVVDPWRPRSVFLGDFDRLSRIWWE